MKILMKSKKRC
jgi:cytosolic carboxypeptidase protein 2/3